jgi:hypothetical protein
MKSKITVTIESDKPIDVVNKEEGGVTINPMTPDVELEEPVQGLCVYVICVPLTQSLLILATIPRRSWSSIWLRSGSALAIFGIEQHNP